jgi:tetratricopeptide (TPR) repeat protein
MLARLKRFPESIRVTREALALNPTSPYLLAELAARQIDAGDLPAARETLEGALNAMSTPRADVLVRLGYVYLREGNPKKAIELSQRGLSAAFSPRDRRLRGYAHLNLARAHGHRGDLDAAFGHIEAAQRHGVSVLLEIEADPMLAKLRADPRFRALSES